MKLARRSGFALVFLALGFAGGALATPRDHVGKLTGAMKHLDAAQLSLAEAGDDFGGHRARAAQLISQADAELKAAVDWANGH